MWQTTGLVVFPLRTNAKVFCILYEKEAWHASQGHTGKAWGGQERKPGAPRLLLGFQRGRQGRESPSGNCSAAEPQRWKVSLLS